MDSKTQDQRPKTVAGPLHVGDAMEQLAAAAERIAAMADAATVLITAVRDRGLALSAKQIGGTYAIVLSIPPPAAAKANERRDVEAAD